ncbi:MAG: carbohydrate kinase family protein [Thermoplasmataceae archaeon]|jgi:sugar/nucleoside kinase (ribokinase family)
MKKFLAYLGHINIDIVFNVPKLESSGSVPILEEKQVFGGTLGNFAMVASSLGLDFDPYAAVSSETHMEYLDFLRSRKIELSHVRIFDGERGPFCYIASDKNNQLAFINQGPNRVWKPSLEKDLENGYDIIHFSTGPRYEFGRIAEKTKAKIVFDPSQEIYLYNDDEIDYFLSRSYIAMCNEQESQRLNPYIRKYPQLTVIKTLGKTGVEVSHNGKSEILKAFSARKIYDTVGAGDAFRAGFYASLYRKNSLTESIRYGMFVSSIAISEPLKDFRMTWKEITEAMKVSSIKESTD